MSEVIAQAVGVALVPDWLLARAVQAGYVVRDVSEGVQAVGDSRPPRHRLVPADDLGGIRAAAGIQGLPPWKACPAGGDDGHEWDGIEDSDDDAEDDEDDEDPASSGNSGNKEGEDGG